MSECAHIWKAIEGQVRFHFCKTCYAMGDSQLHDCGKAPCPARCRVTGCLNVAVIYVADPFPHVLCEEHAMKGGP